MRNPFGPGGREDGGRGRLDHRNALATLLIVVRIFRVEVDPAHLICSFFVLIETCVSRQGKRTKHENQISRPYSEAPRPHVEKTKSCTKLLSLIIDLQQIPAAHSPCENCARSDDNRPANHFSTVASLLCRPKRDCGIRSVHNCRAIIPLQGAGAEGSPVAWTGASNKARL